MDSSILATPVQPIPDPQLSGRSATTLSLQESGQIAAQSASPKRAGKKRIRIQTEKRKEQNRSNQRAFRQRRERYVKDLEVSHHNLRHLVVHQGGEIESLKSRLVDISGGREGTEPSIPLDPHILGKPTFKSGSDSASPSGSIDSDDDLGTLDDDVQEPLSAASSIRSNVPLPPVEQSSILPSSTSEPSSLQSKPFTQPVQQPALSSSLPLAVDIPKRRASNGVASIAPQYWSVPSSAPISSVELPSPQTPSNSSSSSASSFASRGPWTPPDSSYLLQPVGPGEPYLAVEPVPAAPYQSWQSDMTGHSHDFSHWLQNSMQNTQYCLPFQDNGDGTSMPDNDRAADGLGISGYNWQSRNNALGLDNLFPSLTSEDKIFNATDNLQLLGRPLTPFPSLASPAEYAFAT